VGEPEEFRLRHDSSVKMHKVMVDDGMSFENARDALQAVKSYDGYSGFFVRRENEKKHVKGENVPLQMVNKAVILALEIEPDGVARGRSFTVHRPNVQQHRNLSLEDLRVKYERIDERAARKHWEKHHEESRTTCYHKYMYNICSSKTCRMGRRRLNYYVLSGCLIGAWGVLSEKFTTVKFDYKDQFGKDCKIVGLEIPPSSVENIRMKLRKLAPKLTKAEIRAQNNKNEKKVSDLLDSDSEDDFDPDDVDLPMNLRI